MPRDLSRFSGINFESALQPILEDHLNSPKK
jgi:hypothetical protein